MRRAHPLLSVLLVVLGGAAACGGAGAEAGAPAPLSLPTPPGSAGGGAASKPTPSATPEYLRQVGEATRKLATGRVRMVAAATGGRGHTGTTELSVLEGRWDNAAGRSRLSLDPRGAGGAGTGFAALFTEPVALVQVGDVQYLQLGGPGTGWTKLSGPRASALRPIFDLFQITDVEGFLGALACAAPVADVGREDVDGVAANHYRVEAASATLEACIARDDKAGGLLGNLGDSERAAVDVWVDEAALVRRLVVTADEGALGAGLAARYPGATSTLTMTLSGFGEPADIEAPPASEVDDGAGLGDLFGDLESGGDDLDLGDLLAGLG